MRRRLVIIAVFLLAGAVVNVAVAWGCALWSTVEGPTRRGALSEQTTRWEITWFRGFGAARTRWQSPLSLRELPQPVLDARNEAYRKLSDERAKVEAEILGSANVSVYEYSSDLLPSWGSNRLEEPISTSLGGYLFEDARGWPALALWCSFDSIHQRNGGHAVVWQRHAIALWGMDTRWSLPFRDVRAIPIAPIWAGFAVNTLFYAAVLWLLICGLLALRRFIGVKRGLCPACAYPVGTSPVCTECGKALPRQAKATT